ncbi:MAG: dolichyl-phosphate beta-glucosyltransferase [Candidatus Promineifilaceae bacterium]|jgi:dolichyl-phosphate beta-glucosyltransferase
MQSADTDTYLSVIIPAFNEERRILATLVSIHEYLSRQPYTWEILVVLDGPTDGTLDQIRDFATERVNIHWIDRKENRGKGYTVREGMLAAKGQIRLFTDADNSTDISHFQQMQPLFEEGYDIVITSRDRKDAPGAGQAVPQPSMKRFLGNAGNLFIQLVAVPGIWDTQCGFKAFTAVAAERIFSTARIDGWGFDIEALALARQFGYRIAVIPARWIDHAETHVRTWNYVTTLLETIHVRWNLWSGAYKTVPEDNPVVT